jgi:hypothetical protein
MATSKASTASKASKAARLGMALDVRVTLTDRPPELKTVVAYAFSQGGTLLALQALDKEGGAQLSLPVGKEAQSVRLVLGPEIDKELLDVGEVLRRGGVDRHVTVRPDIERLPPQLFEVGPDRWQQWLGRFCVVNGTLNKRVVSGGIPLELPVCHAAVDIYEVDSWPLIIPQLPDIDIARLREIIDGPWPPVDLPIPPRPMERFQGELLARPHDAVALNPQPLPPLQEPRMLQQSPLPADLQLATRASRSTFERALITHVDLLRPIFCWLFPRFVRKTKLVTVMTDECGHFRAVIWRSIFNLDQPDLYFVARQRVWFGWWATIYEPTPVVCNTWWNYVCGTEVKLVTTHPLAHACPPCPPIVAPNNWVLFMALGNSSVWRLHGANDMTKVGSPGFALDKFGLLDDQAPWGGTVRPRLEFDNSLRELGVMYYRVSFKRAEEDESAWRASTESINRHYTQEVGDDLVVQQYALGPQTIGASINLCEIPPALPPVGQWSLPNAVLDTQSAVMPTSALAPGHGFDANGVPTGPDEGGLWQIKVELFNTAGHLVDPAALGITWRVPKSDDLSGTIQTADAAALGLVDVANKRMVLTVRVDNNPSFARIDAASINGITAADECGVLNYSARSLGVAVPFLALQRNRFADYAFYVQRGAVSPPEYSIAGMAAATPGSMPGAIPPSPPADPLPTVDSLLEACTLAGFTEQLRVAHQATDGWSRQSSLDSSDARAFVLAPVLRPAIP